MFTQLLNIGRDNEKNQSVEIVRNSPWFDDHWYASRYEDVYKKLMDPARHYCFKGWKENRNPSADFNTMEYLRKYPECGVCPIIFEQNRNSKVDLSVCVIVKDEAPYIKEWLDYHLMLGVKRFYIYDNESSDNIRQVLMPYVRQGIVVYKYYPGEARQVPAYNECVKDYGDKTKWLAIIDIDEFIVPLEKDNITDFLADYDDCCGVAINWLMYDSNGYKKKPRGGVPENYTRIHYDDIAEIHFVKSIVKPEFVDYVVNAHYCAYKNGLYAVDENKKTVEAGRTDAISRNKIQVNHYWSKSKEEFYAKVDKGMADRKRGEKRTILKSHYDFPDYKYDYSIYKYITSLYPRKAFKEWLKCIWLNIKNALVYTAHCFMKDEYDKYIDEKWYFSQYPEAKTEAPNAKQHYFNIGWKRGYNPSRAFDTNFYLSRYPDVKRVGINPLSHFVTHGRLEGRLPLPDIDETVSKSDNKEISEPPTVYREDNIPSLPTESKVEIENTSIENSITADENHLEVNEVDRQISSENQEEDVGQPENKKDDVEVQVAAETEAETPKDFLQQEVCEEKIPEKSESWFKYLFINKNIEGKSKEYVAVYKSRLFDEKWYLSQYPEVESSGIDAIEHYLTIGWEKGYNPSKKFNTKWYIVKYRDVRDAKVNPLSHYILHGKREGRECFPVHEKSEGKLSNDNPMISVVVANHNCEDTISETLDALVKQTYKNFEVIVVDDGSEDGSVNIVKKYVKKYPFILLHRHKHGANKGLVETIKLGVQKAKGKYIAFCESGDLWQPNCLQRRVDVINQYPGVNIVSNGVEPFGDEEFRAQYKNYIDETEYLLEDGENFIDLNIIGKMNCIPTFSCVMIKKDILEKLNFTSPLPEWFDFWLYRQVLAEFPLYYIHEKLVKWHMNKDFYDMLKTPTDTEKNDYFIIKSNKITGTKGFKCTNYDIVKKSKYWDEKYYLKNYKNDLDNLDAVSHYICIGWRKGYNPSARFDNNAYIKAYSDISKANINPLIHYEICGSKEKRKVYPVNNKK